MMYSLSDHVYTYCEKCMKLANHKIIASKREGNWIVMMAKCSFCNEVFEACYIASR